LFSVVLYPPNPPYKGGLYSLPFIKGGLAVVDVSGVDAHHLGLYSLPFIRGELGWGNGTTQQLK
jgi:hypothetical protein